MRSEAKNRKEQYQWEAKSQWRKKPLEGDICVVITLYFGDKRRRDWDNFHKISQDSLAGIAWVDDSQIKKAIVHVDYDKTNPRMTIEISKL